MEFKGISIILIVSVVLCFVHTNALPRDILGESNKASINPEIREMKVISSETGPHIGIPGRVTCPYEEATEDSSCQEHCLPKGYSYGICVSGTCSCI